MRLTFFFFLSFLAGLRPEALDFSPRRGRGRPERRPPRRRRPRHLQAAEPAQPLAAHQGPHRAHSEPCTLPGEPRASEGAGSHSEARAPPRRGVPGGGKGEHTVRWSNCDRRDPKMGVFLQSTEATPRGHFLK